MTKIFGRQQTNVFQGGGQNPTKCGKISPFPPSPPLPNGLILGRWMKDTSAGPEEVGHTESNLGAG